MMITLPSIISTLSFLENLLAENNNWLYYPTLPRSVQIKRETSTNITRYYSTNSRDAYIWSERARYLSFVHRGYYMAAREYEFYLPVLLVSLTSERSERLRDTISTR